MYVAIILVWGSYKIGLQHAFQVVLCDGDFHFWWLWWSVLCYINYQLVIYGFVCFLDSQV